MKKAEAHKLAEAMRGQIVEDKVPDGWFTAVEIAEATGYSHSHTLRRLIIGVRAGEWEMRKFRRKTTRGSYPIPHYKPADK
mgnify:CR=1 FL=1